MRPHRGRMKGVRSDKTRLEIMHYVRAASIIKGQNLEIWNPANQLEGREGPVSAFDAPVKMNDLVDHQPAGLGTLAAFRDLSQKQSAGFSPGPYAVIRVDEYIGVDEHSNHSAASSSLPFYVFLDLFSARNRGQMELAPKRLGFVGLHLIHAAHPRFHLVVA